MPRGISRMRQNEVKTILVLDTRSKSAFASDQNDLDALVGCVYNLSTSGGPRTVTGLTGGIEGRMIQLVNVGTDNIFLANESSLSFASDRILTALSGGANYTLVPKATVLLSYNNTIGRWLIVQTAVSSFDPEIDTPLNTLLGGKTPFKRSGGIMAVTRFAQLMGTANGFLKTKFTAKTSGDTAAQAFGVVTGAQVSFTMPAAGDAIIAVMGSLKSQVFNVNITPQGQLGGRFDSDTPQQFSAVFINNGAGADYVNQFPMMGIWGKSLASGAHTADLCWGSAGGYDLYSDATIPAVIVVFYPG